MAHKNKKYILFVEDDDDLRESLMDAFRLKDYEVYGISSIERFYHIYDKIRIDLAFIDLNLPDGSGYAIARELRQKSAAKIIILSARETIGDRVEGYTHGADIYMVKPTSIVELLAACEALLRPRQRSISDHTKQNWALDDMNQVLMAPNGASFKLSGRQFSFLKYLMERPNQIVERTSIWNQISPGKLDASGKALSMFVARFRRDVEVNMQYKIPIETISGKGFVFKISN